jgi:hypothetical protein
MSVYTLQLLDDPVVRYRFEAGAAPIGEIRRQAMHADILYLGEHGYWLVEDAIAEAAASGASLATRLLRALRFNRSYSLRDESQKMASAARHWNPLRNADWIDYSESSGAPIRATPRSVLGGDIDLTRAGTAIGSMAVVGLLQHRVTLDCNEFAPIQAAFLMYVVHRCWGNNPYVGASSP